MGRRRAHDYKPQEISDSRLFLLPPASRLCSTLASTGPGLSQSLGFRVPLTMGAGIKLCLCVSAFVFIVGILRNHLDIFSLITPSPYSCNVNLTDRQDTFLRTLCLGFISRKRNISLPLQRTHLHPFGGGMVPSESIRVAVLWTVAVSNQ